MQFVDTNLDDAWRSTLSFIVNEGHQIDSRDSNTREILGYQLLLTNINSNFLQNKTRKLSAQYGAAEVLWYLFGSPKIKMIKAYAPQYARFAENGIAFGAYGHRWKYGVYPSHLPQHQSQITALIELLKKKPSSRQAVVTMYNSCDLLYGITGEHKDIPCTLSLQFLIRDAKLNLIATMRSNDAWLGLPYDVFAFTTLQKIIADEIGIQPGVYIHQAGSEHIYDRNFEKCIEAAKFDIGLHAKVDWKNNYTAINKVALPAAIAFCRAIECSVRESAGQADPAKIVGEIYDTLGGGTVLADLLLCAISKWIRIDTAAIHSFILRTSIERKLNDGKE